ncbi:MAG: hypothetical protein KDJ86_01480 [Bauldia sp.]|uniref:hypothetical protein n=1 Tax=Bauldia sp. TaxID=2575872 RepID=UPI001DC8EFAD|nr:hypothetical protein [Bauldia sp.]MCB1494429.1 hypothetical protein [Bauldia sp.]
MTLAEYRQHVDLHILPFIGHVRLSQLSVPAVALQDQLREEGRSAAMVKPGVTSTNMMIGETGDLMLDAREIACATWHPSLNAGCPLSL